MPKVSKSKQNKIKSFPPDLQSAYPYIKAIEDGSKLRCDTCGSLFAVGKSGSYIMPIADLFGYVMFYIICLIEFCRNGMGNQASH